eukprot:scaffold192819_cov16-Tisochrysis_lutea.AAC.2
MLGPAALVDLQAQGSRVFVRASLSSLTYHLNWAFDARIGKPVLVEAQYDEEPDGMSTFLGHII